MVSLIAAVALVAGLYHQNDGAATPRHAMVTIAAGEYLPLYDGGKGRVRVKEFAIDAKPVTRGEFLEFVRVNPKWQRSKISGLKAEPAYLADWAGDFEAGSAQDLLKPVTQVSWFAAKSYCEWRGERLPTIDEWEYVESLAMRAKRSNVPDMHLVPWEWVLDFNSVILSSDSRGIGATDIDMFCASAAINATDRSNYPAFLRYAFRSALTGRTTVNSLGFRCAK